MKQVHPSYSFVASTKTITLTGLNIDQDQLLLIVNATRGVQYFNFADSSLRATVTAGANTTVVLTDASTTGHANGDALVIYYDDQVTSQLVSGTVTANPGTGAFTVSGTVGLDNASLAALENVTVTVGAAVSVSNFPASQVVTGSVAVTTMPALSISSVTISNFPATQVVSVSNLPATQVVSVGNFPASQVVTGTVALDSASLAALENVTVTVGAAISGTVTVTNFPTTQVVSVSNLPATQAVSGTVTVGNFPSTQTVAGTVTANVANSVTIGAIVGPIGGSVFKGGSGSADMIRALPYFSQTGFANYNELSTSNPFPVAGTVTVGALPSGALTTRFGSVTTANTAQITSAVTNTNRKYLLAQNISAGTVTIGIGFSPTTTQGIQLTAGGGLTFDSFCPTGAVYWLGAVTGAAFTILEG